LCQRQRRGPRGGTEGGAFFEKSDELGPNNCPKVKGGRGEGGKSRLRRGCLAESAVGRKEVHRMLHNGERSCGGETKRGSGWLY